MTALVARAPLHPLPMSTSQRASRRSSARLQAKDATRVDENSVPQPEDATNNGGSRHNARKRKPSTYKVNLATRSLLTCAAYEEEDDGFMFSRVKKKRQKDAPLPTPIPEEDVAPKESADPAPSAPVSRTADRLPEAKAKLAVRDLAADADKPTSKRQKKKMSFSTPVAPEKQPVRKSMRLSQEDQQQSPVQKTRRKNGVDAEHTEPSSKPVEKVSAPDEEEVTAPQSEAEVQSQHSGTKIALPFADTPVIRRNKEMRENKGKKGERRSSLSLRGRRASSLIETGNSNGIVISTTRNKTLTRSTALPHNEVDVADFYKHIEADGLPEPRRMRQLLTWCATRSLDQKPMGASFEVSSAIAAARVIQDELLKDLGNKSELSDWFSREDVAAPAIELPQRPNPKNVQNVEKIAELERQIER